MQGHDLIHICKINTNSSVRCIPRFNHLAVLRLSDHAVAPILALSPLYLPCLPSFVVSSSREKLHFSMKNGWKLLKLDCNKNLAQLFTLN